MIGNCQIEALLGLYSRFAQKRRGQAITYIRSYEEISAKDRVLIENADVIIEQVQDFRPKGDIAGISSAAERIGVPVVNGGFLWPFAGQSHPTNESLAFREGGPYGAESSDGYLNRLIKRGASPSDALATYRSLDVNAVINLDRLLEVSLERQRARDHLTGFSIAPLIEAHFRQEPVFLTPYHPNLRVALGLAEQFFGKMGVGPEDTARMRRVLRRPPFPKEELPVHPAVARHFGLTWAGEDRRYQLLEEGRFSFDEFVMRYMAGAWNEPLHEGIHAARTGEIERAYILLTAALQQSPGSAAGYATLGYVLEKMGRHAEAVPAVRRAFEIEPDHAGYRLQLALLLYNLGENQEGEQELRRAASLDPGDPHFPGMLANRLIRDGAFAEAAAIAAAGLVDYPYTINLHLELGHARDRLGESDAALQCFQTAVDLDPGHSGACYALAQALERRGRASEAIELLYTALRLRPEDASLRARLSWLMLTVQEPPAGWNELLELLEAEHRSSEPFETIVQALLQSGRLDEAESVVQLGLERFPHAMSLRRDLVHLLERRGAHESALGAIRQACALTPGDPLWLGRRGELLARLGRLEEAEEAYRAALACAPENAHLLGQFGHVLSLRGLHDEAIAARGRASALEPSNAHRRVQFGHTLMAAGELQLAEPEIRAAIAAAPEVADFHIDLSHLLSRSGRLEEALDAARYGLALAPNEARFQMHLAALLEQADAWEEAEAAYRAALALRPEDGHTLLLLGRLLARRGRNDEARVIAQDAVRVDPANNAATALLQSVAPVAVAG
jgi:tetratricopeptide (TPR) repeat protein